jgi:hypothetical protein
VKSGIDAETAKKIQGEIKASKLKVQAPIQGDAVRITGAKRDDLQAAMALLRKELPTCRWLQQLPRLMHRCGQPCFGAPSGRPRRLAPGPASLAQAQGIVLAGRMGTARCWSSTASRTRWPSAPR